MSLIRFTSRLMSQSLLYTQPAAALGGQFRKTFTSTAFLIGVSGMKPQTGSGTALAPMDFGNAVGPRHQLLMNPTRKMTSLSPPLQSNVKSKKDGGQRSQMIPSKEITKNMFMFSKNAKSYEFDQKTLKLKNPTGKPLAILMAWLLAKPKHIKTYAELYINLGFDVVAVQINPWQLLWPTKGCQLVAADVLKFLENNLCYSQILIHGFSVGAYQFGEVMVHMSRDMKRYQQILDRISCQIWDSAADITEIPVGVPKAIFPKNMRLQNALRNYTLYHLKTFHNQATIHYMRASQMFHSTLVKAPALFLVSKNDLIGPESSNLAVKENWEPSGVKVTFKSWDKSGHVAHLYHHKEEYLAMLYKHLEENMLEGLALKSRAKL